jgi:hypothetical protein
MRIRTALDVRLVTGLAAGPRNFAFIFDFPSHAQDSIVFDHVPLRFGHVVRRSTAVCHLESCRDRFGNPERVNHSAAWYYSASAGPRSQGA